MLLNGVAPLFGSAAAAGPQFISVGTTSTTAGGATLTISSVTIPSGSLIVIAAAENAGSSTGIAISDGGVNSYTAATSNLSLGGAGFFNVWYAFNSVALSGATITYTKRASGNPSALLVGYATGCLATSGVYDGAVTATSNSSGASPQTGTVTSGTPAASGELFIAITGAYSATNPGYAQDSGNSWNTTIAASTGANAMIAQGDQVNAGTGTKTYAPTITGGASTFWATGIYGFKHA